MLKQAGTKTQVYLKTAIDDLARERFKLVRAQLLRELRVFV
jgi:hypothetical protein